MALSMNKLVLYWSFSLLLAIPHGIMAQNSDIFQEIDLFFQKHVVDQRVDYHLVGQDRQSLEKLATSVSSTPWESMEPQTQKAFLINAYNVLVVHQIMQHYPITTSQEVPGFFDQTKFQLGQKKYTLNQIENKLLRPVFKDPRLHFVLVCGALGCPPIVERAYRPEALDRQLERQTRRALNDPAFVKVQAAEKRVELSQIFEWYTSDFTEGGKNLISYVNQYRTEAIPEDYKVAHYPYDWTLNSYSNGSRFSSTGAKDSSGNTGKTVPEEPVRSNVQTFTPSVLLRKNQVELKVFNNLYTQKAWYNPEGNRAALNQRQTFYGGIVQFLYGASDKSRINVGFDVNFKGVRYDADTTSSPLEVLSFTRTDTSRMALTSFGPKVKFSPFKKLDHFSIQSAFWVPVAPTLEGTPWIDRDRYTWWNQFFYDYSFLKNFQVFTEADLLFYLSKDRTKPHTLQTPLSLFLSWFPTGNSTVYGMIQYAPTYQEKASNNEDAKLGLAPFEYKHQTNAEWSYVGHYAQTGIGAKYQVLKNLEVELLYTNFFTGKAQGAGSTYNIGLRYLR